MVERKRPITASFKRLAINFYNGSGGLGGGIITLL